MNYQENLRTLVTQAQEIHANERSTIVKSLNVVGVLDRRRAAPNMGMTVKKFAGHIGLSEDQYLKRTQASRVLRFFPETQAMLQAGDLQVSHLAAMNGKLTQANRKVVFENTKGKSKREVMQFMARIRPDGTLREAEETQDLRIALTKAQMELVDRAREVLAAGGKVPGLAEIVTKALEDLLSKRDPLRQAERAAARSGKKEQAAAPAQSHAERHPQMPAPPAVSANPAPSAAAPEPPAQRDKTRSRTAVPAQVRHQVWLRDQGQCAHRFPDGSRCEERMMIELDHKVMVCHGGKNTVDNLELKCRYHNQAAAAAALGVTWYNHKVYDRGRPADHSREHGSASQ